MAGNLRKLGVVKTPGFWPEQLGRWGVMAGGRQAPALSSKAKVSQGQWMHISPGENKGLHQAIKLWGVCSGNMSGLHV